MLEHEVGILTLEPVQTLGLLLCNCRVGVYIPSGMARATPMGLLRLRPPLKAAPDCPGGRVYHYKLCLSLLLSQPA